MSAFAITAPIYDGVDEGLMPFAWGVWGLGIGWVGGSYLAARWTYRGHGLDLQPMHRMALRALVGGAVAAFVSTWVWVFVPVAFGLLVFGVPVVAVLASTPRFQEVEESLSVTPLFSSPGEGRVGGLQVTGRF